MQIEEKPQDTVKSRIGLEVTPASPSLFDRLGAEAERAAGNVFILPAVIVVLFLAVFPLVLSLYMSFSRLKFVKGGFEIRWVGLANFKKLFLGSEKRHFLGVMADPSPLGWLLLLVIAVFVAISFWRYLRGRQVSPGGMLGRIVLTIVLGLGVWLIVRTILSPGGRPGTIGVTLIYVFIGIALQYLLGLGLAMLTTQNIAGRRFFRIIYLLPMMITPVGVAYMFRMLTDTDKGPFQPIWQGIGLAGFSWVTDPWGARAAVMVGDIWQWTPFMFIVLLAALEGQSVEQIEAALVDGANRWQVFWHITLPQILPVSTTLILIRMIEAFKIVDLPNVLTNGGPGTATESLTLQAFFAWRTLDLGGSAAVAYTLLVIVTVLGISFVNLIRGQVAEVL